MLCSDPHPVAMRADSGGRTKLCVAVVVVAWNGGVHLVVCSTFCVLWVCRCQLLTVLPLAIVVCACVFVCDSN